MIKSTYLRSEYLNESMDLNILDSVFDAILIISPSDEVVLEVSKSACDLYGFTYEEFVGMSLLGISKNTAYGKSKITELLTNAEPLSFSTVQYKKSGEEMYLDIRASLINYRGEPAILSINRDITDQVDAFQSIMEQREKYASAISSLDELVFLLDENGNFNDYHQHSKSNDLYMSPEYFIGKHYSEVLPSYISNELAKIEKIIRFEDTKQKFEYSLEINGETKQFEATVSSFRSIKGEYAGFTIVAKNITERKAKEKQLLESEALIRGLMNSVRDGIIYCTAIRDENDQIFDFKPVIANKYYCELNGLTLDELLNSTLDSILPQLRQEGLFEKYISITQEGIDFETLSKIVRKGKTRWVIKKASKFQDGFIATLIDITERINENLKFQNIINNSLQGILIHKNNRVIFANPAAEEITGYSESELKSFDSDAFWNIIHPDDNDILRNIVDGNLENSERKSVVVRIRNKNLTTIWLELFITPIEFEGEAALQIVFIDSTKKILAEQSEILYREKLKALVNSIPDLVYYKGLNHEIQQVNDSYAKFFGRDKNNVEGKFLLDFLNRESSEFADEKDDEVFQYLKPIVYEQSTPNYKNEIRTFEIAKTPIFDYEGNITGLVGIAHDVTERKQREEELKDLVETLNRLNGENQKQLNELNQLNLQLTNSKNKLKELVTTKDKFFSIIAHDLKNPFNLLINVSNLLLENFHEYTEEEIISKIKDINESSKQSYSLLENLLNWSRTQSGNISFSPAEFDLYEIIINTIYAFKKLADKKEIKIKSEVELNTIVCMDFNMISTVLRNLISNAIKFTMPGGKIEIFIENQYDEIIISVSDNGIGIDDTILSKLFRIDSNISHKGTLNESGTGLGLIISKEFVEKHGGKIWAESKPGSGSTFKFSLPVTNMTDNKH